MDFSTLSPISDRLLESVELSHYQSLGRKLKLHTAHSIPDLSTVRIVIFGVLETRNAIDHIYPPALLAGKVLTTEYRRCRDERRLI